MRCARVYPTERSSKIPVSDLKTLALRLTSKQAGEFASALRNAMEKGGTVMVVAFRQLEKDGTHRLSARSEKNEPPRPRRSRFERLDEDII